MLVANVNNFRCGGFLTVNFSLKVVQVLCHGQVVIEAWMRPSRRGKLYAASRPILCLAATESGGLFFHCHRRSSRRMAKTSYCQDYLRQEIIASLECKIQFLHCQRSVNHLQCQMLKLLI